MQQTIRFFSLRMGILALGLWVIPQFAFAEWRVLGPMMTEPTWLDEAAYLQAQRAEADAEAAKQAILAQEAWEVSEDQRLSALPRQAETYSNAGNAKLSFGCTLAGELFVAVVLNGYETDNGIVKVTHMVDQQLPWRNPWMTVPADLELRAFSDRAGYVEQFLRAIGQGQSVKLQIETFPELTFLTPGTDAVIRPILENCRELERWAGAEAQQAMAEKPMMEEPEEPSGQ